MKRQYRIVKKKSGLYNAQYLNDNNCWIEIDNKDYSDIEEAKEACSNHASDEPKVVWSAML